MTKPIACPKCQEPMWRGRAQVHGTVAGFLLVGLSWMKLFFRSDSSPREVLPILAPGGRHEAFYCPRCRSCLVTSAPWASAPFASTTATSPAEKYL